MLRIIQSCSASAISTWLAPSGIQVPASSTAASMAAFASAMAAVSGVLPSSSVQMYSGDIASSTTVDVSPWKV